MGARRPQQETVLLHRDMGVRVQASSGEGGRLHRSLAGRRPASGSGDVCLGVQRQHEVLRLQTAVTLAIRPLALWWTLCFGGCPVVDSRIGGWQSESCLDSGRTRPRPMLRAYDKGQGTGPRANNSVLYRTGTALFSSLLIDRTGPFVSALRSRFYSHGESLSRC
jgi:hypothetical protein